MRSFIIAIVILASGFLVSQALAGITTWSSSPGSGPHALQLHLTTFGALTLPEGEFGRTDSDLAAFAVRGEGVGLELSGRYRHELESGLLVWVDFNPVNGGALEDRFLTTLGSYGIPTDRMKLSASGWTSVWALAKVGIAPKVGRQLRALVDVYGGCLYLQSPGLKLAVAPSGRISSVRGHSNFGLAAGAGAGLSWRDRLSVGLLYLSGSVRDSGYRQPVSVLHATLGYSIKL